MDERTPILHPNSESKTRSCGKRLPCKIFLAALILTGVPYFSVALMGFIVSGSIVADNDGNATKSVSETTGTQILKLAGPSSLVSDEESIGKFAFNGDEGNPTWFPGFETVTGSPDSILEIAVNNAKINGSQFSESVKKFQNLKSIQLINITVFGKFSRVYLPLLANFKLRLVIHSDEEVADYKTKAKLRNLIFFDKIRNQPHNLVNVSNLGVNLEVIADGSKVIVTSESNKEVVLTMNYCEDILKNIKWSVASLTLGNCTVSQSSIPQSLTSLTLGNVGLSSGNLSEIVRGLPQLNEMYGSVPNLQIDLRDFPITLKSLCLSGIKLNVPPSSGVTAPNVKEITLGGDVISSETIQNFYKIFPNVETIGIFGMSENASELLESLMTSNVTTIVVMYFPQKTSDLPMTRVDEKVNQFLTDVGIPKGTSNFLITLPEGGALADRVGSALSEDESDLFRYRLMGWYKIDSYTKFLRVIQEGRNYTESVGKNRKFIGGVGGEVWPLVVPPG